jgi:hypothetical protein
MKVARALRPDFTIAFLKARPTRFPERRARVVEGLRKAGMPEG